MNKPFSIALLVISTAFYACAAGPVSIIDKETSVDVNSLAKKNLLFVVKARGLAIDNPLVNWASTKLTITQDEYVNIIKSSYKKCHYGITLDSAIEDFSLADGHWYKYLKGKSHVAVLFCLRKSELEVTEIWYAGVYTGSLYSTTFYIDVYSYGKFAMTYKLFHSVNVKNDKEPFYDKLTSDNFVYLMDQVYSANSK